MKAGRWLLVTIVIVGCSKSSGNGEVEGVVTFKGEPLEGIQVTFMPDPAKQSSGPSAVGYTDAQGRYKLVSDNNHPGVVVGHHRVTLRDLKAAAAAPSRSVGSPRRSPDEASAKTNPNAEAIAKALKAFFDASTTPLSKEVKSGPQTFAFEISTEASKK
jgi:hypothetical protein